MKYHHLGIPTQVPRDGESYLAGSDIHATDHEASPFKTRIVRRPPS